MQLIIHTDGGARGNPGPAAVGVVIEKRKSNNENVNGSDNYETVAEFGKVIGETTNNVAEYTAVIEALQYLKSNSEKLKVHEGYLHVQFYLDSTLVVNQINGTFKVKDGKLRALLYSVRELEQMVGGIIVYTSVPREQNSRADYFVNKALDENR